MTLLSNDRPHSRRPHRFAPWVLLVALGVLAGGAAWLGVAQGGRMGAVGRSVGPLQCETAVPRFSGYATKGSIDRVGARWTVPRVLAGPAGSAAVTWVGALGPADAFVQIGTEVRGLSGTSVPDAGVWSDTALSYHPRVLFPVRPGDVVEARIVRGRSGWRISLTDLTRRESATIGDAYPPQQLFSQAKWVQEDPTTGCAPAPYPSIGAVTFRGVTLNGSPPRLRLSDGVAMNEAGGIEYVPSRFRADRFTIAAPHGASAQYLRDKQPVDLPWATFFQDVRTPGATGFLTHTLGTEQEIWAGEDLVRALTQFGDRLTSQRWPRYAVPDVRAYVRRLDPVVAALRVAVDHFQRTRTWTLLGLRHAVGAASKAGDRLRHAIGLPPSAPGA